MGAHQSGGERPWQFQKQGDSSCKCPRRVGGHPIPCQPLCTPLLRGVEALCNWRSSIQLLPFKSCLVHQLSCSLAQLSERFVLCCLPHRMKNPGGNSVLSSTQGLSVMIDRSWPQKGQETSYYCPTGFVVRTRVPGVQLEIIAGDTVAMLSQGAAEHGGFLCPRGCSRLVLSPLPGVGCCPGCRDRTATRAGLWGRGWVSFVSPGCWPTPSLFPNLPPVVT